MHKADTLSKLLLRAMTQPAPPLATVASGLPEELLALVDKALAFDQWERWSDARAMQAAIREVRARSGGALGAVAILAPDTTGNAAGGSSS